MQKKWKYSDILCIGCGVNSETGQEILSCEGFNEDLENMGPGKPRENPFIDSLFYYGSTEQLGKVES